MQTDFGKWFWRLAGCDYCRLFPVGAMYSGLACWQLSGATLPVPLALLAFCLANGVLYPYARYAYFVMVEHLPREPASCGHPGLVLALRVATTLPCWACALLLAPIGSYLYDRDAKRKSALAGSRVRGFRKGR